MSYTFFEILGKIAGIGGLSIGLVLVIFRQIIAKNIFPILYKDQGYKLLRLMIILTFSIALIGILAWLYSDYLKNKKEDSNVKLVDITQSTSDSSARNKANEDTTTEKESSVSLSQFDVKQKNDTTTIIDFKLRNVGEQVAFLKKITFYVKEIEPLYEGSHHANVPISANYDIILPPKKTPYSVSKEISQSIPAGGIDRFTFTVTSNDENLYEFMNNIDVFIYIADITIEYDDNDKKIEIPDFGFVLKKKIRMTAATYVSLDDKDAGIMSSNTFNTLSIENISKFSDKNFTSEAKAAIINAKNLLLYKPPKVISGDSVEIVVNNSKFSFANIRGPFTNNTEYNIISGRDSALVYVNPNTDGRNNFIDSFWLFQLNQSIAHSYPKKVKLNSYWTRDGQYSCLKFNDFLFLISDRKNQRVHKKSNYNLLRYSSFVNSFDWIDSLENKFK